LLLHAKSEDARHGECPRVLAPNQAALSKRNVLQGGAGPLDEGWSIFKNESGPVRHSIQAADATGREVARASAEKFAASVHSVLTATRTTGAETLEAISCALPTRHPLGARRPAVCVP